MTNPRLFFACIVLLFTLGFIMIAASFSEASLEYWGVYDEQLPIEQTSIISVQFCPRGD